MDVKRSELRSKSVLVERDPRSNQPDEMPIEVKEAAVQGSDLDLSKVTMDSSQVRVLRTGTLEDRPKKPFTPDQLKLVLPYEISITSAKGTFTHKVETQHDVEILMQYLMPMNRPVPPAN